MFIGNPQMYLVDSDRREEVWAWADAAGVEIEYHGSDSVSDVWRVVDPAKSGWFKLRWS